ncbi:MAG: hypothetical protein HC844_12075 [Tabrizicola sp.]|nr:hypothetical protein [Tabrizicola sp.]
MTLRALLIASLLLAPLCGPAALAQTATEAGEGETGDAAEELRALSKTMMIPELFALLKAEGVSRGGGYGGRHVPRPRRRALEGRRRCDLRHPAPAGRV